MKRRFLFCGCVLALFSCLTAWSADTISSPPHCALVLTEASSFEQELAIAENASDLSASHAMARFAARAAAENDHAAFAALQSLAQSGSKAPKAGTARLILEFWPDLRSLAKAQSHLALAHAAAQLVQREFDRVLQGVISGTILPDPSLVQRLKDFGAGPYEVILALKKRHIPSSPNRPGEDEEASVLFHDKLGWQIAIFKYLSFKNARDAVNGMSMLASSIGRNNELNGIVNGALYGEALALRSESIAANMSVPEGIFVKDSKTAALLKETLVELVRNAIKYSDPAKQGRKEISISYRDGKLYVKDNGIGMLDVSKIWQEGYREMRKEVEGTGNGLAYVKTRVEEFGGSIAAESMPKIGSIFQIDLGAAIEKKAH